MLRAHPIEPKSFALKSHLASLAVYLGLPSQQSNSGWSKGKPFNFVQALFHASCKARVVASYLESQAHESMSVKVGRSSAWRNGGRIWLGGFGLRTSGPCP